MTPAWRHYRAYCRANGLAEPDPPAPRDPPPPAQDPQRPPPDPPKAAKALLGVVLLLAGLLHAGCGLTLRQLDDLQAWQRSARAACKTPGHCPDPRACISAVVDATDETARKPRVLYEAARLRCLPYLAKAVP